MGGDYTLCSKAEEADLIILNTCHIREKAKHKVDSRLGVLAQLRQENPDLVIAVSGCTAQAEGKKLLANPNIDLLVGPGRIREISKLVKNFKEKKEKQLAIGFPALKKIEKSEQELLEENVSHPILYPSVNGRNDVSRFVNIQQGCNNFCTFCVVPFTRGKEISDPAEKIVQQADLFVKSGVKEITLLGQNVNSYGLDLLTKEELASSKHQPFVDLLSKVADIEGLVSLRFTTSNPHDFSYDLAKLFSQKKALGKYIHLPVQSGSDKILKMMKRKVTRQEYLQRISWLREFTPDIAISTDIIVGFPGETDEDFEHTMSLVSRVRFSFAYAFKYSKRKHTAAIRFKEQVPEEIKTQRLKRLNALLDSICIEENEKELGKERSVLFMYPSKKEKNTYFGRSEYFRLIKVYSEKDIVGQQLNVKVTKASKIALEGQLI